MQIDGTFSQLLEEKVITQASKKKLPVLQNLVYQVELPLNDTSD